ncbi:MAG: calcium-binding protein, partial [Leisingera sp.]
MNIDGTSGSEILNGTNSSDLIKGFGGDDTLNGSGGKDTLVGGDGDDQLNGDGGHDILRGGSGDNFFSGGAGDDTYQLTGRYDVVETGLGDDLIDLSNFAKGEGFLTVGAHSSATGLSAIIDGEEDFGLIITSNGGGETGITEFRDLNNALQLSPAGPEGGMQISGTAFDDEFFIDPGEDGWIQIRPGEGNDLIRIEGTEGTVRLDYVDAADGIYANLKLGIVIDGGEPHGRDVIIGDGRLKEFRGSDHDDRIHGSQEDDRIISRQGDDTISGGRGFDTIRYDRSGVDAVDVDLEAGTATGTWRGESFTDSLKNI